MRKTLIVVFALTGLFTVASQAEAGWLNCPGTAAPNDREFKLLTSTTSSCLGWGGGGLSGSGDSVNQLGWITLDKSNDTTTGSLQGALSIVNAGGFNGTFTITNPLAWATYSQIVVAFKTVDPSGADPDPDWAAFVLPTNTKSGSWQISGTQKLQYATIYGVGAGGSTAGLKAPGATTGGPAGGPAPAMPEPGTLLLVGSGIALAARRARQRRLRRLTAEG